MLKVFTKFRDPVNSYPLGEMQVGVNRPGRYSGFDVMTQVLGLEVNINHSGNIKKASANTEDEIIEITFGAILTPNGSVVHHENTDEETGLNFTLENNVGNDNPRFDYLICEHEYIQVVGGVDPTFFIQQGPNDGELPVLANPEKQIIVGIFEIAPEGYLYTDVQYNPVVPSLPGDMTPQQIFNLIQELVAVPDASTTVKGIIEIATGPEAAELASGILALTPLSLLSVVPTTTAPGLFRRYTDDQVRTNTPGASPYHGSITSDQLRKYGGIRDIVNHITNSVTIPDIYNGLPVVCNGDGGATPLITFSIDASLIDGFGFEVHCKTQLAQFTALTGTTILVPPGKLAKAAYLGAVMYLKHVGSNATPDKVFTLHGDLASAAPTGSTGLVPMNAAVPYFPIDNALTEFDGTGLGTGANVLGWAICNGNNGTRNLTGRFLRQRDSEDPLCNNVGDIGGSADAVLVEHHHELLVNTDAAGSGFPGFEASSTEGSINTEDAGESGVNKNLPPFYTTIYIQRVA